MISSILRSTRLCLQLVV